MGLSIMVSTSLIKVTFCFCLTRLKLNAKPLARNCWTSPYWSLLSRSSCLLVIHLPTLKFYVTLSLLMNSSASTMEETFLEKSSVERLGKSEINYTALFNWFQISFKIWQSLKTTFISLVTSTSVRPITLQDGLTLNRREDRSWLKLTLTHVKCFSAKSRMRKMNQNSTDGTLLSLQVYF
jgi:hypothetical protein